MEHVTPLWRINASITIDIKTNTLVFGKSGVSDTPAIDAAMVRAAFSEMRPHIQLYCSNRKCIYQYTVASDIIRYSQKNPGWGIDPLDLYYESFVTGNLWVQNNYINQKVCIFSRVNVDAEPITSKLLDFQDMGKNRVLNRVRTLVVFS